MRLLLTLLLILAISPTGLESAAESEQLPVEKQGIPEKLSKIDGRSSEQREISQLGVIRVHGTSYRDRCIAAISKNLKAEKRPSKDIALDISMDSMGRVVTCVLTNPTGDRDIDLDVVSAVKSTRLPEHPSVDAYRSLGLKREVFTLFLPVSKKDWLNSN